MRHDTTQLFGEALGHLFMYSGPGMNVSICCEVVVAMSQPGLNIFQGVVQIQHSGYAQIHFTAVGRMDADTKITEQIPVLQGPVQIPSQSGEVTDQQNVNVPIHRLIMKFQQAGAVIEFQPACYIAGSPNDFKACSFA